MAREIAALAMLLDGQGKYEQSEPLYRQAIEIFSLVYGAEHFEVAVNLNHLAAVREARGDYAGAEQLYRRALEIKEKLFGEMNLEVAFTINCLAALYSRQQKYDEAEWLYRRALAIFEKALDPWHPSRLACLENLFDMMADANRLEVAVM
jgi:tetratricopeptide (TPR) repeat protein